VLHISATNAHRCRHARVKAHPQHHLLHGHWSVAQLCQIVVSAPQQVEARPVPPTERANNDPVSTQKKESPSYCLPRQAEKAS
jgi:hypothetical protein